MKNKIKEFIVVEFEKVNGAFDWPPQLPIPRIGERLMINCVGGVVVDISQNLTGNVYELRIKVSQDE